MKVLHLPLKEPWYRMIQTGEKGEEYRDFCSFWIQRLFGVPKSSADFYESNIGWFQQDLRQGNISFKPFTHVHFTLGYPKKDDKHRNMMIEIKEITLGEGKPEWGAEDGGFYFIIRLKNANVTQALSLAKFGDKFKTRDGKTAIFQKTSGFLYKYWFITDTDYYPVANSGEADMKKINNPLDIIDICYEE